MNKIIVTLALLFGALQASADPVLGFDGLHGGSNSRGGHIQAYNTYCGQDLCSYDLNWNVRGQNATIVLEVRGGPEDGTVKLFGCSGSSGQQRADWIRRDGAEYIFHLFDTKRCTVDVFYREYPVDSVVVQEFGGGNNGGGGWGYDRIDAYRTQCYSDMCEYDINWTVQGNASVVTVVDPATRRESLFACGTQSGSQLANWIKRDGTRYEFRLYNSTRCSQDVGRYERAVDTIVVRER
jgi:hypothetical protein